MYKDENELLEKIKEYEKNSKYKEALEEIVNNEDLIVKKYYEITRYKIEFLCKLEKYIDALMVIKNELGVVYIPTDFEHYLNEKYKEITFILRDKERKVVTSQDIEKIDKLDESDMIFLFPHLKEFNLIPFVTNLQNVFDNSNISNLVKSLLIASLSDCKLDYSFTIVKEETTIRFNPSTVFDIRDSENYQYIVSQIKKLYNLEINCAELMNRLCIVYLLDIYPLVITDEYCDDILTAAYVLTKKMMNLDYSNEKFDDLYEFNTEKIDKICEKMNILL